MTHPATLAVLAIAAPPAGPGTPAPRRVGDATLVPLALPFPPQDARLLHFALRFALGDALDGHDDPRGVFVLPSGLALRGTDHASLVTAHAADGLWIPWPEEPPEQAPPPRRGPDTALLAEMTARLGAEAALDLAIPLEVALVNELARPHATGTAPAAEAAVATAMGADFAARLTEALRVRLATELAHGTAPPPIRFD
jgi:hypothetical protein